MALSALGCRAADLLCEQPTQVSGRLLATRTRAVARLAVTFADASHIDRRLFDQILQDMTAQSRHRTVTSEHYWCTPFVNQRDLKEGQEPAPFVAVQTVGLLWALTVARYHIYDMFRIPLYTFSSRLKLNNLENRLLPNGMRLEVALSQVADIYISDVLEPLGCKTDGNTEPDDAANRKDINPVLAGRLNSWLQTPFQKLLDERKKSYDSRVALRAELGGASRLLDEQSFTGTLSNLVDGIVSPLLLPTACTNTTNIEIQLMFPHYFSTYQVITIVQSR